MTMPSSARPWRVLASLLGLTGVALGAIAAHALSDAHASASVERAATFQLIHALALWLATICAGRWACAARWAFLLGILGFCGAIYAKYLLGVGQAVAIAPFGGTALMVGWLLLAFSRLSNEIQKPLF